MKYVTYFEGISSFNTIFQEESPAHDVVYNDVFNQCVVGPVDIDCTVKRLVNTASANVRFRHITWNTYNAINGFQALHSVFYLVNIKI